MYIIVVTVLILLYIRNTASQQCEAGSKQRPIYQTDEQAILAGDVITFRANNILGFIGSDTNANIDDPCKEIPLRIHSTETTDTHFIVIPVAVLDDSIDQKIVRSTEHFLPNSLYTRPRLVSTLQLVHASTGRLLGIPSENNKSKTPVLLPILFRDKCTADIGDYHTIWDLDHHEIGEPIAPVGPPSDIQQQSQQTQLLKPTGLVPGEGFTGGGHISQAGQLSLAGLPGQQQQQQVPGTPVQPHGMPIQPPGFQETVSPPQSVIQPPSSFSIPTTPGRPIEQSLTQSNTVNISPPPPPPPQPNTNHLDISKDQLAQNQARPPALPPIRPQNEIQDAAIINQGFRPLSISEDLYNTKDVTTLQTNPNKSNTHVMNTMDAPSIPALTDILAAVTGSVDTRQPAPITESIEHIAFRSSQKATDSMQDVSSKLESFTSQSQDDAEDQQRRLLEKFAVERDKHMMQQNTNLAPLFHNTTQQKSAMVSLRIREINSGPIELVRPCITTVTEPPVSTSVVSQSSKKMSIFSRGKQNLLRKVKNELGKIVDSSVEPIPTTVVGLPPLTEVQYDVDITSARDAYLDRGWNERTSETLGQYTLEDITDTDGERSDWNRVRKMLVQGTVNSPLRNIETRRLTNRKKPTTIEKEFDRDTTTKQTLSDTQKLADLQTKPGRNPNNSNTTSFDKKKQKWKVTQNLFGYHNDEEDKNDPKRYTLEDPTSKRLHEFKQNIERETPTTAVRMRPRYNNISKINDIDDTNSIKFNETLKLLRTPAPTVQHKIKQLQKHLYKVNALQNATTNNKSSISWYKRLFMWISNIFTINRLSDTIKNDEIIQSEMLQPEVIEDDNKSNNQYHIVDTMQVSSGTVISNDTIPNRSNPLIPSSLSHVEGTDIINGPNLSGGEGIFPGNTPSSCTLRLVAGMENAHSVQCLPTASSCPTTASMESNILWSVTRVAFSSVPTSSIFLAESMTNINYDMDYATVNTYPYSITQVGLRNFSPFEQFLTARTSKFISHQFTFRWLVGFTPSIAVTIGQLPMFITGTLTSLVNSLLNPINSFVNSIVPGLAYPLSDNFLSNLTVETITFNIPFQWSGAVTHLESQEVVATYSVTSPPQAHLLGRAIAHMGKTSVPFTLDVTRRVHVPAGIYGQTTGQLIAYDYRVPGVYDGAQLINTEFLIDAV